MGYNTFLIYFIITCCIVIINICLSSSNVQTMLQFSKIYISLNREKEAYQFSYRRCPKQVQHYSHKRVLYLDCIYTIFTDMARSAVDMLTHCLKENRCEIPSFVASYRNTSHTNLCISENICTICLIWTTKQHVPFNNTHNVGYFHYTNYIYNISVLFA